MPPDLANPPSLFLGSALYLNAWFELDFERNLSEYEPIGRTKCFAYAKDYGLDYLQAEDLWYYVASMDKTYLKWRRETAPKKREPTTGKTKSVGKP